MPVQRDPVVGLILRSAISVHRSLGPGLFESIYRDCLAQELVDERLTIDRELILPVVYKGIRRERCYRLDLVVDNRVVIEIKSVSSLLPVHSAQILTYMKLSGFSRGLLMNFNEKRLMDGVKSFLNGTHER